MSDNIIRPEFQNSFAKEQCEICKEYAPYPTMMAIDKLDQRVVCGSCALRSIHEKQKRLLKMFEEVRYNLKK